MNHVFATTAGEPMLKAGIQHTCTLFGGYETFPVCAEAIAFGFLWEED